MQLHGLGVFLGESRLEVRGIGCLTVHRAVRTATVVELKPDQAIARISAALSPGGSYQFVCANHLFLHDPHCNSPTFGSKASTRRLMRRRIESDTLVGCPVEVGQSLNWITVSRVRRIARADKSLAMHYQTETLRWTLERALDDAEFVKRRAGWKLAAIGMLRRVELLRLASLVTAMAQPAMDVRLSKRSPS